MSFSLLCVRTFSGWRLYSTRRSLARHLVLFIYSFKKIFRSFLRLIHFSFDYFRFFFIFFMIPLNICFAFLFPYIFPLFFSLSIFFFKHFFLFSFAFFYFNVFLFFKSSSPSYFFLSLLSKLFSSLTLGLFFISLPKYILDFFFFSFSTAFLYNFYLFLIIKFGLLSVKVFVSSTEILLIPFVYLTTLSLRFSLRNLATIGL